MRRMQVRRSKISGFSFIHNGVEAGYPFVQAIQAVESYVDEMVVVDMQSTDETRSVLAKLDVRILDGTWVAGMHERCLEANFDLHSRCSYDIIWFFEADEVFSDSLAREVARWIDPEGIEQISVPRLQLEQNFQRCRWYPEYVHRIFSKGTATKAGHTLDYKGSVQRVPTSAGFLWDLSNCFRDNWLQREKNQAELWGGMHRYRCVPFHFTMAPVEMCTGEPETRLLNQEQWTWMRSPFDLPDSLKSLVGVTDYRIYLRGMGFLS